MKDTRRPMGRQSANWKLYSLDNVRKYTSLASSAMLRGSRVVLVRGREDGTNSEAMGWWGEMGSQPDGARASVCGLQ